MKTSTEKLPVTTKKQKFVGFDELYTRDGEAVPVQISQVEDRDFNFHKLWLQMFINGLDRIANKKMKLAFWIIDHLDKENKLVYTFRRMAEETGLSIDTIIRTMKELQNGDPPFLKKLQSGVYVVNPDVLYKGSHQNRMGVIYQFGELPTKEQAEKRRNAEQKPSSDAPEPPNSRETTNSGENVPEKDEKPENEPKFELPSLDEFSDSWASDGWDEMSFEKIRQSAIDLRNKYFQQFSEQIPLFENQEFTGKMKEIFQNVTSVEFWSWTGKISLENLPKFHEEWKAKQYKKQ